jgi:DNA polymerase III subunit delta
VILTLTGDNSYAAARAERQLVDAFLAKHGANGIERVDAEGLEPVRLPDLLQGATLFAPVRLVILKNVSANKAIQEPLAEALAHAASDTTVVIADAHLDKRTKLYKFLKSTTDFREFPALDEHKLTAWVQQVVSEAGASVSKTDAQHLVQRVGYDQWRLHHEIEKLVSYQDDITRGVIDSLVEPSPEGNAFELLDAALAGNTAKVSSIVAALKTEEDPYKLFGLLASQVHALAVTAAAGGRSPDVIAKDAGLHPFVVRKTQPIARKLGIPRVQRIAREVADCDWHLKSTGADPWQLLETTLQKIAR